MIRNTLIGCLLCASLFGDQHKSIDIHCTPYFYGEVFSFGYGFSLRLEKSQHNLELAPFFVPPTSGYFSTDKQFGGSCSYYYTFFQNASLRPYLGLSYTYSHSVPDLTSFEEALIYNRSDHPYQNLVGVGRNYYDHHFINPLIGLQYSKHNPVSFYGFIDLLGPIALAQLIGIDYHVDVTKDKKDRSIEKHVFKSNSYRYVCIPRAGIGISF